MPGPRLTGVTTCLSSRDRSKKKSCSWPSKVCSHPVSIRKLSCRASYKCSQGTSRCSSLRNPPLRAVRSRHIVSRSLSITSRIQLLPSLTSSRWVNSTSCLYSRTKSTTTNKSWRTLHLPSSSSANNSSCSNRICKVLSRSLLMLKVSRSWLWLMLMANDWLEHRICYITRPRGNLKILCRCQSSSNNSFQIRWTKAM